MQNVAIRGSTAQSRDSDGRITIYQNVTWDAPPNHHSIQHYVVGYQKQGQSSSNVMETLNNVTWVTLELFVHQGETPITYSVQVAAVSSAGQGEFNERIWFSYSSKVDHVYINDQCCSVTHSGNLQHYFSYTGPGKPTNVSVQAVSCDKLMVTWGTPDKTGGLPIVGYNVTTGSTVKGLITSHKALIDHQPQTAYRIAVMATNAIGQGEPAEITGSPQARGTECLQSSIALST